MVMGLPTLPKGGRVGVGLGLDVGVGAGVGVSSGVLVGEAVGVGAGACGVQAVTNPMIKNRARINRLWIRSEMNQCVMRLSDPFGPGWVSVFFVDECFSPLIFFFS